MAYRFLQNYPGLRVSRSGFDLSEQGKFERHCHQDYELIYILQGSGKYIVEGAEYPLHPHAVLLMHPYAYHYVCPEKNQTYERVVINFDPALLPQELRSHSLLQRKTGCYFSVQDPASPVRAAYEILDAVIPLSNGGMESTAAAENFLRLTVPQILLLLTLESPGDPLSSESATVRNVIEYLNQHLEGEFSLEELSRRFFVSKYHLCRIFHQQTGASILTYFNAKRMALAQRLLADGMGATAVALRLGFRDYSSFYRVYRKYMGQSPIRMLREEGKK